VERALLFDSRVHDKWSFEQLPLVQRIMNTVEKTSTVVTLFNHSIRLTSHIMSPVSSSVDSSDTSLSEIMNKWISHQHTLLVVAQETQFQSDQHKVVENDVEITDYPINSYVLYTPHFIEDLVLDKQIRTHVHNLRPFIFNSNRVNPIEVAQQNEQEFVVRDIIVWSVMIIIEDLAWTSLYDGLDTMQVPTAGNLTRL